MLTTSDNNRSELAIVGCPNLCKKWGATAYVVGVYTLVITTAKIVSVTMTLLV